LSASAAYHLKIRDRQVAVLGGVFSDTVLFGLCLRIFLGSMQSRVRYGAGDRHHVPNVLSEIDAVAFRFPGATVLCGHLILVSVFLHASSYRTGVLMCFFLWFVC